VGKTGCDIVIVPRIIVEERAVGLPETMQIDDLASLIDQIPSDHLDTIIYRDWCRLWLRFRFRFWLRLRLRSRSFILRGLFRLYIRPA
jgi:hypothetical protein